jgi:hypothetical protein
MSEAGERIAVLESQASESTRQRAVIVEKLERQDADLLAIRNDVHAIRVTVASYKGFFAGFSFAVAALGGLIGAAVTALWNRMFP